MAARTPDKLKAIDVARFAHRAAQLEKVKPAIAYWCNYWILNQILVHRLQDADAECNAYATSLMDKLEHMKVQHATDDALTDELAAQLCIEQFGLETFARADNAIRANKASRQTADTLQAAATFLDLLQIWHPQPSPDMTSKIKYAKFHALRIARAIRAGEDPNVSNPVTDPEEEVGKGGGGMGDPSTMQLDPSDPEVQRIEAAASHQPSVEDVPEEDGMAGVVRNGASPVPEIGPPSVLDPDPLPDDEAAARDRANSSGGGYFPAVAPPEPPGAPMAPTSFTRAAEETPSAPPAPSVDESDDPQTFYTSVPQPQHPPTKAQPYPAKAQPQPQNRPLPPPSRPHRPEPPPTPVQQAAATAAAAQTRQARPQQQQQAPQDGVESYNADADDTAVAEAQKHARWAISALNFEDVGTAVRELRLALGRLGAGGVG